MRHFSEITEITSGGTTSIFANSANGLNVPYGLAVDGSGNLYASNFMGNSITKFTKGVASVFAHTGLSNPTGLAFDSAGNLYVANSGNNTIEKFNTAGTGTIFASTDLNNPQGIAFDTAGDERHPIHPPQRHPALRSSQKTSAEVPLKKGSRARACAGSVRNAGN